MKLSDTKSGDIVRVVSFENECNEMQCKLEAMGFRRGDIVKVLQKSFFGPIQVEANGTKIALCRGQAKKIEVEKIKE
ncbi:ferrous iron transport protein A [Nitratiruptor sp. YY08-26]|uniref:FeoA family protein n=1 Tax=unclassified Nitratiruptor TaxID=2624044 RepID=UPI0019168784|nr:MULTISPECIES: FeoA family protein [unclassified Nitratiruptor]BCD62123.1 ferrous iron transport protein A [Nitratiruptor sp. YY08-13]BCD66059.1 ferrous iron transport protein A [Nitratiruptor sp. YY08-26]